jgi:probable F420-dependent oxidoreductase
MKIGINIGPWETRPEELIDVVRLLEELGYESVWVAEHLVLPTQYRSRYPFSPDGIPPIRSDSPIADPLGLLCFVAAVTTRIRLGTAVYLLPLRHPLVTARMAVTVDVLSRGRLALGVGVGWLEEEFIAAGEDFGRRGRRMEECVQALKALWTQEDPEFHGRFFEFASVKFEPKPVQRPHPPIIFGGETDVALRRAARLGDGWLGLWHTPESATERVQRLRKLREEAGRGDRPFEITLLGAPAMPGQWVGVDRIREYEEAGVDRIMVAPWAHIREARESLEHYAREVLAKLPHP